MQQFRVDGVVHGGEVILEVPLDLPDGTVVTVTGTAVAAEGIPRVNCSDAEKRRLLTVYNRLDLIDDPDWEEKAKAHRIAAVEQLVLEAERLRESRLAARNHEPVTVSNYDTDEVATTGPDPDDPQAREAALQFYLDMLKRKNRPGNSDGQTKIAG